MDRMKIENILIQKDAEIRKLRKNGYSYKDIGKIIGCSSTPIRRYCVANKIKGSVTNKLIGQSFEKSNLIVLERDFNPPFRSHETAYKCQCQKCGDINTYRKSNVVNGPGCHKCSGTLGGRGYTEWNIGQKFGFLEIIGKAPYHGKSPYLKCRCECGKEIEVSLKHLKGQGHSRTISCGCKQQSSGELKIAELLKLANIEFKTQYRIKEFSSYAPFDFAIFNNQQLIGLIEYDGQQHFEPVEHFGGIEQFKKQQEIDQRKNDWCKINNIKLIRIPYTDYNKLSIKYLSDCFCE